MAIAVVSYNEKGFWQGDLFDGEEADTPEAFFTCKRGEDRSAAVDKAHAAWPQAEIRIEDECYECGGEGRVDSEEDGIGEECAVCGGDGKYLTLWSGR